MMEPLDSKLITVYLHVFGFIKKMCSYLTFSIFVFELIFLPFSYDTDNEIELGLKQGSTLF